jgi:hypothetical protein
VGWPLSTRLDLRRALPNRPLNGPFPARYTPWPCRPPDEACGLTRHHPLIYFIYGPNAPKDPNNKNTPKRAKWAGPFTKHDTPEPRGRLVPTLGGAEEAPHTPWWAGPSPSSMSSSSLKSPPSLPHLPELLRRRRPVFLELSCRCPIFLYLPRRQHHPNRRPPPSVAAGVPVSPYHPPFKHPRPPVGRRPAIPLTSPSSRLHLRRRRAPHP